MKKVKKLNREYLKKIKGGSDDCNEVCPAGPYGPGLPGSCAEFEALPECCKFIVSVSADCFPE
ncbi:bacteriocin-like protein [Chryseobacterium pennipullorum]|uniref:Uncharacterized protein n=1 Tax=Chryseobacterium pennipullorum TaxID=2258963 RepID=A0A3D9B014_9FLAO|nr:hypothetical protein [Chryseobacterium pennipullorum]REC46965.1 hypothetical protein DRF67_12105 [Chryseobacterium pennipullorum]